jgi:ADP-ribose 1''-phosphate phosphatase
VIYRTHCTNRADTLGTTLLIPPQPSDVSQHWIACLFTSEDYGRRKGSPDSVVENTRTALEDLKTQLEALRGSDVGTDEKSRPGEIWACRFNSVNFKVPWERTRAVIEDVGLDFTVVNKEVGS